MSPVWKSEGTDHRTHSHPQRNGNSGSWGAEGKWVQPSESHVYSSNWPSEAHSESEWGSVGSILDAWVSPTFQTPRLRYGEETETEGAGPATASSR